MLLFPSASRGAALYSRPACGPWRARRRVRHAVRHRQQLPNLPELPRHLPPIPRRSRSPQVVGRVGGPLTTMIG